MGKKSQEKLRAALGQVLDGRFRLDRLLGQGGMGAVYVGTQLSVGRDVAVKLLLPELGEDQTALQRFEREATVIAGISHPNIVRLIDHGRDEATGGLFLVMEYVEGETLRDVLERGRLDPALVLEFGLQASAALAQSHAQGIVHRDLKPENLMVQVAADGAFVLKVLDFGIAQLQGAEHKLTKTGAIFGTPLYMSPEQCNGKIAAPRSDLYALGAMLFEMLTGHPPFRSSSFFGMLASHMTKPVPELVSLLGDQANPDLCALVVEMLAKSPTQRPASARAVVDRLEVIQEQTGGRRPRALDAGDAYAPWVHPRLDAADFTSPDDQAESPTLDQVPSTLPTPPVVDPPVLEAPPVLEPTTTHAPSLTLFYVGGAVFFGVLLALGIVLSLLFREAEAPVASASTGEVAAPAESPSPAPEPATSTVVMTPREPDPKVPVSAEPVPKVPEPEKIADAPRAKIKPPRRPKPAIKRSEDKTAEEMEAQIRRTLGGTE